MEKGWKLFNWRKLFLGNRGSITGVFKDQSGSCPIWSQISGPLYEAFVNRLKVKLHLGEEENGPFDRCLVGTVEGFDYQQIFIRSWSGVTSVEVPHIRSVEVLRSAQWYE